MNRQALLHLDNIIHLGAGRCRELDDYLHMKATHLFLVEADPHLARDLQGRASEFSHVHVVHRLVAGQAGPSTFRRYSLPDVGSLHKARLGLQEIFPGLKLLQELPMDAVKPEEILQPMQLHAEENNLLVIDVPGEELPVLKALRGDNQLHLFEQLHLYCGRQPLYEGSVPAASVLQWLQNQGFDLVEEDDMHDPDRPRWKCTRNQLQLRHRELQLEVAELTNICEEHKTRLKEAACQIEKFSREQAEQAKLAAEYKAELKKSIQVREKFAKLAREAEIQVAKLTHEKGEQAKSVAEYKAELEKITQANKELEQLANERLAQVDDLNKALDEQTKFAKGHLANYQKTVLERDKQADVATAQKAQLKQAQRAVQERDIRITEMETMLTEASQRQRLLDDEMVKAEAHIELIKDLLLREPGV